jgi:hypothetical protein
MHGEKAVNKPANIAKPIDNGESESDMHLNPSPIIA